jgi:hypothetical protein
MEVNLLRILNIYFGERFIIGTRGCIKSSVSLKFDGKSFIGLENPIFLKQYVGCSGTGCIHTWAKGE